MLGRLLLFRSPHETRRLLDPLVTYPFIGPTALDYRHFFYWPAAHALKSSLYLQDLFGFSSSFVGLDNYRDLANSTQYLKVSKFTLSFTLLVTFFSLSLALLLAVKTDNVIRGAKAYRTLLMWVYAVAPPGARFIDLLMFNQSWGPLTELARSIGWNFKLGVNFDDTASAMVIVSIWKQVPVNFLFFLSGLQSIPKSVRKAALIDNRSVMGRFWDVTFPLLAPTGFFC